MAKLILFDGVCNLCNNSVQFIIKRDKKNRFLFASLQGRTGQEYLHRFGLPENTFNSFLLVEDGTCYTRSTAALRIARSLSGLWPLLYAGIVIPRFIRDAVYNLIARNRYKWFGKKEECWVPTPELKKKFLD